MTKLYENTYETTETLKYIYKQVTFPINTYAKSMFSFGIVEIVSA